MYVKQYTLIIIILLLSTLTVAGEGPDEIVFGIVDTSPPYMFVNEKGEADGFVVDLFYRIFDDLDISFTTRADDFPDIWNDLITGEVDIFPGLIYTPEREELIYFPSTPIKTSWGELFVSDRAFYKDISDISGKTIGIVRNDQNGINFISFMENFDISYSIREFDNFSALFNSVRNGDIYGGVSSNQHQLQEKGIVPTTTIFSPNSAYAVTGREKGDFEKIDLISQRLRELKDNPDSYYYELERKWYIADKEGLDPKIVRIALIALLILLTVAIILFLNNRYLKSEVARQIKQLEKQRYEKERVNLKNDFLSSVSHELRTPMNIITSLVYLLSQSEMNPDQREKINKISRASGLLLNIINNFLDFNRLEKGRITLEKRPFSPQAEMREIVAMFQEDARSKGLYLDYHLDKNIPPVLEGDPFRLTQIMTNLINNAVKFSKRGTVSLAVFVEELSRTHCRLSISVKDEGIGIEEDKLDLLFLPFTQADESISRQFGGSGLGLAICNQLVNLMDGSIKVNSQAGKGSEFTLSLPFKISRRTEWHEEDMREHFDSYPGSRVLYVEDNPINREIGLELFKLAQVEVDSAANGLEALELIRDNTFDLVLMDIQMPYMDGLTAVRRIREQEARNNSKRLPVVALTAHFLEEDIKSAYDAGMDGHISKPISIGKLNKEFIKWLPRHQISEEDKKVNTSGLRSSWMQNADLPGINLEDVMERFGGIYDLLVDSLDSFTEDYALMPGRLLSLDSMNKRETLKGELHTLKGVMGSLGMNTLFDEVVELEKLIGRDGDYKDDLQNFCAHLENQIKELEDKA